METLRLGTSEPGDVAAIEAAISRALAERSAPPPYEELCALHQELLRHIEVLTPLAVRQIDRLNRGTLEWYGKRSKLGTIPYQVADGLGPGLMTAAAQVRSLGYTTRFLLENAGLAESGHGTGGSAEDR